MYCLEVRLAPKHTIPPERIVALMDAIFDAVEKTFPNEEMPAQCRVIDPAR